jgi:hypothetical protein
MAVYRQEFLDALTLLAQACNDMAAKGRLRPVLVGGAAVEFHTGSAMVSGDFDFVTADQREFEEILLVYGFKREDRPGWFQMGLYHPELSLGVQVVSGELFDGKCEWAKIQLVEVGEDGTVVPIAGIEDMIADRLGQFVASAQRDHEMLDQAVKLFQLADSLDGAYLEKRIREDTIGELGAGYLRERAG